MRLWGGSAIVLLLLFIASSEAGAASLFEFARVSSSRDVAAADTVKVKKERVRKEAPPARLENGPEVQVVSSESEGDFWSDCLGDIFGMFIGSICSSIFGGSDDESEAAEEPTGEYYEVPLAVGSPSSMETPEPIHAFPYYGIIEPMGMEGKTVWLWDRPGAYLADGITLEAIPRGTEVKVTNYELHTQTGWLQVSRLAPDAPRGWVRQIEVHEKSAVAEGEMAAGERLMPQATPQPMPLTQAAGRKPESQPATDSSEESSAGQPRWEIGAGVSMPVFSQSTVREEYQESAYRIGVEADAFLAFSMKLGLCVGYLHANGTPLYNYDAGTITDSPQESSLDIFSIGLPFGQSIPFAGGSGFFSYGLGPALFMVRESALIHVYENSSLTSARTDELTKWKGGAEALLAVGGLLGGRVPLSFQARFAFIPWKAEEEKSLTLDYLGTEDIAFFTFGIGIGFYSF